MSVDIGEITTVILNTEDASSFQDVASATTAIPVYKVRPTIQNGPETVMQVRPVGVSIPYTFAHVRQSVNAWVDVRVVHTGTGLTVDESWSPGADGNYTIQQVIQLLNAWLISAFSINFFTLTLSVDGVERPYVSIEVAVSPWTLQFRWSSGPNTARSMRALLGGVATGDSTSYSNFVSGVTTTPFPNWYNMRPIKAVHILTDLSINPAAVSDASTRLYSPTLAIVPIYRDVGRPHTRLFDSTWRPLLDNTIDTFSVAVSSDQETILNMRQSNWSLVLQFRRVPRPPPEPVPRTLMDLSETRADTELAIAAAATQQQSVPEAGNDDDNNDGVNDVSANYNL